MQDRTLKNMMESLSSGQKAIAKRLGISEAFLCLLLSRGLKESELDRFLNPSLANLSSPMEIGGMSDAVKRIKSAIEKRKKILIFGDYDCDGICAVSILVLAMRGLADVSYFIPNRKRDGYGMSVETLKRVISANKPDMIISVDCGITAVSEAEYLKSVGVELIVTDHHEPQETLPDCIIVDPKIEKKGFFELCGAGVALKLVEALFGRNEAVKYLDIAAIATLADVVPLSADNRIIAHFGIEQMKKNMRRGIKMLLGQDEPTSQNIMFRLAPRMNAAGRLNSAAKVVGLFIESDYFMLKTLAEELLRDNQRRQELCEKTALQAMDMLRTADFRDTNIIALYCKDWEAGVLGIAAARLTEEFNRPTVLFTNVDGILKGSARSVPEVNIFELFCDLRKYFLGFGGHSQAAGVTMNEDNFEAFRAAANERVREIRGEYARKTAIDGDMELPLDFDFLTFARELKRLEPTGYGNPKPTFLLSADGLAFNAIGYSDHVKCSLDNLDLLGFTSYKDSLFAKTGEIKLSVGLDVNCFNNRERAQGIIRKVSFRDVELDDGDALCLNLYQLGFEGECEVPTVDVSLVESELYNSPFGTAVICFSDSEYEDLCKKSEIIAALPVSIASKGDANPENCVVLCPNKNFAFEFYNRVFIAGKPLSGGYVAFLSGKSKSCATLGKLEIAAPEVKDEELRAIYVELARIAVGLKRASNMRDLYKMVCERKKIEEWVFRLAMSIFFELGLVKIGDRGMLGVSRKSVDLLNSAVYRNIKH